MYVNMYIPLLYNVCEVDEAYLGGHIMDMDKMKKYLVTMDNVYDTWIKDPWMEQAVETRDWLDAMAITMFEKEDCLGVFDEFMNLTHDEIFDADLPFWMHIHPNEKNDKYLFPEFLGFCRGRNTLRRVLKAADSYMEKAGNAIAEPKTVTILTDKWDPAVFAEYEDGLIGKAFEYGIIVNIFLVTAYGISKVVFLNEDSCKRVREHMD